MRAKKIEVDKENYFSADYHHSFLHTSSVILIINPRLIPDITRTTHPAMHPTLSFSFSSSHSRKKLDAGRQENFRPREGKTISSLLKDPLSSGPRSTLAAPSNDTCTGCDRERRKEGGRYSRKSAQCAPAGSKVSNNM